MKDDENMGLKGAKTMGDKRVSSLMDFRWPSGENEPRGCPTPGACSADQMLAQMRKAIGAAMCAIGLAKALPNVAAEYDFEPVYHELTEAWRASEPPRPKSRS
jgi:hypothetical protein